MIAHYVPGFKAGGPVRSVANLVDHLGDDFHFRIITSDRDLGDDRPFEGIVRDEWVQVGKALVYYASPRTMTMRGVCRIMRTTSHDLVYLNSLFATHSAIEPLVARKLGLVSRKPFIIAPRGQFSAGALGIKPIRKKAFIQAARLTGMLDQVTWHASSEYEAKDIEAALPQTARKIVVAPNLPAAVGAEMLAVERTPGPLRLVFLSRISPMKNLSFALQVLSLVKVPVAFHIHGPSEDTNYRAECDALAAALPGHIEVHWHGTANPVDVPSFMANADLFFLPTLGENYGHVIAEALSVGTPVLISDATPWRNLARAGVGDDLPLGDPGPFVAAIERAAAMSPAARQERRELAFNFARVRNGSAADVEANMKLFARALGTVN